jgi:hypothetical protein
VLLLLVLHCFQVLVWLLELQLEVLLLILHQGLLVLQLDLLEQVLLLSEVMHLELLVLTVC